MQAILKQRNVYTVLFVLCTLLTPCFVVGQMWETVFILSMVEAVTLILLIRQSRMVYNARLIYSSSILRIPAAVLSDLEETKGKTVDEAVVSTFGALVGGKVYKWGCDGLNGSRLKSIEMDRERISLTFGNETRNLKLELLHGLDEAEKVLQVKQNLLRETGVKAVVSGW